ncbi:MAG: hypothetical protein Q8P67_28775 [archaeon]|nr:hypothetical protein [archaeon]
MAWTLETSGGEQHISYSFEFWYDGAADSGKWSVSLRYSQVHMLHGWLCEQFPHFGLPSIPRKFGAHLFSSRESTALKRVAGLGRFLTALLGVPRSFSIAEVRDFFEFNNWIPRPLPFPLDQESGMLYIKLVDLSNLGVTRPNRQPKAMVETRITESLHALQRPLPLRSATHPDSTAPKFFEEYVFGLPSRRFPVRFQIWELRALGLIRHVLGHIQLETGSLLPFHIYDLQLPVEQGIPVLVSNGEPTLRCFVHFTPMAIPKPFSSRLPDFRIQIDTTRFFPGQVVSGLLILNVGAPYTAKTVHVTLVGVEETHWTTTHSQTYTDSEGRMQTRTVTEHHGRVLSLIHERKYFWIGHTHSSEHPIIQSGSYVWPFEFTLPPALPPSFKCAVGSITYGLRATVTRPLLAFNKQIRRDIKILAPYTSANPLPTTYGYVDKLPFRSADQVVYLEARLSHDVVIIGEHTLLHLTVQNNTSKAVKYASVQLVGHIHATDNVSSVSSTATTVLATLTAGFPVGPGETRHFETPLFIDKKAHPTLPADLSPLIQVNHTVEIECDISGFLTGKARASVPVIVSHRIPAPEMYLPPPPPTEQPPLESILNLGVGLPHFPPAQFAPSAPFLDNDHLPPPPADESFGNPLFAAPPPVHSTFGSYQ